MIKEVGRDRLKLFKGNGVGKAINFKRNSLAANGQLAHHYTVLVRYPRMFRQIGFRIGSEYAEVGQVASVNRLAFVGAKFLVVFRNFKFAGVEVGFDPLYFAQFHKVCVV